MLKRIFSLVFLVVAFLAGSCAPAPQPTVSPLSMEDSVATMAAATIQALPTNTPYPTPSLVPTLKLSPTASPTETPIPTLPKLATPTFVEDIVNLGNYWTSTPEAWACNVDKTDPSWGEKIKAGKDFRVVWRVWNVGAKAWSVDELTMFFIAGERMHNRGNNEKPVYVPGEEPTKAPITITPNPRFTTTPRSFHKVHPGDKLVLHIRMYAPKEPGLYTSAWGLRRGNSKLAFCAFSVTIRVEGKK